MTQHPLPAARVSCALLALLVTAPVWAQSAPLVGVEPVTHAPAIPPDLALVCNTGPSNTPSPTCPVLVRNGYTYWAFSFADRRIAMAVVAYDSHGNLVKRWNKFGARHLWKITLDPVARTASFHGQGTDIFTMSWDELDVPPPSQGTWVLGNVRNNTDKHVMFSFHVPNHGVSNATALKEMTMAGILISDYGILSIDPRGNTSGCTNPAWRAEMRIEGQAWEFYYNTNTTLNITINPDRQFTFIPGVDGQVVPAGQPATCQP